MQQCRRYLHDLDTVLSITNYKTIMLYRQGRHGTRRRETTLCNRRQEVRINRFDASPVNRIIGSPQQTFCINYRLQALSLLRHIVGDTAVMNGNPDDTTTVLIEKVIIITNRVTDGSNRLVNLMLPLGYGINPEHSSGIGDGK